MADAHVAVPQLLRAAELEIKTAQRGDGGNAVRAKLTAGVLVGQAAGGGPDGAERREYRYRCRTWPGQLDDVELMVRAVGGNGSWTPADVTVTPDGLRRVVTAAPLGASPPDLQVREDESASWVALAKRLRAAAAGTAPEPEPTRWLLGQGRPAVQTEPRPDRYVRGWDALRLNVEQRTAVTRALASEVMFLWGPPGTGKTDVVAHIIEGCYRQGHNVLFLAPTNVAVDQALHRVCRLLEAEDGFSDGLVQRTGKIALPALATAYGDRIREEEIVTRISAALHREIEAVTAEQAAVRGQLARRSRVETLALEHGEAARAVGREEQAFHTAAIAASAADQQYTKAAGEAQRITDGFALRKQSRLEDLGAQMASAQALAAHHRFHADAAGTRLTSARLRADGIRGALAGPDCDVSGLPGTAALRQRERELETRAKELNRQVRAVADAVRARCRVKGATVAKAVLSPKLLDRIDVVVIDEAGMVDLPSAWFAAGLAGKRLVLAGDFRQLPAVTKSAEDRQASDEERRHAQEWTARDPFHAAGLVDRGIARTDDPRLVALRTQYRMREAVCGLVNTVAYPDSPLRTGRDEQADLAALSGLLGSPLILVDTSTHRIAHPQRRNAHQSNEVHEAIIHEIIRSLQYDRVLPSRKAAPAAPGAGATDRLAVIAPYRNQVTNLSSSLKYRFGEHFDGLADTVHRFQGSERPIVVLDTVAGAGSKPGFFYQGTDLASNTCRLLNVGLSRARDHLIVVADVAYLRGALRGGPALAMVDHLERHAVKWPVEQLVPIREAAELAGLGPEELARPAFFPADEVDRAVAWDLYRATKSIEVFCAFLSKPAMDRWLPWLAKRAAAGATVTVYTRPPEEDRVRTQVERLRTAGCVVEFRERMHEKVLIVDDNVLWHGSLNLLSHTGSRDLMMRLTDSSACDRVRRILETAREDKPAWRPWNNGNGQSQTTSAQAQGQNQGQNQIQIQPGAVHDGRLYLAVPYEKRNEAKSIAQAHWDKANKLWYVDAARFADPAGSDHHLIRHWLT